MNTRLIPLALITAVTVLLASQAVAYGAIDTRKGDLRCTSYGADKDFCNRANSKLGTVTTRGTLTQDSYTPRGSMFVFDALTKEKVILQVDVKVSCKSRISSQSTMVQKSFTKKVKTRKGRNVQRVAGKKMNCPAGFSTVWHGVSYMIFTNGGNYAKGFDGAV